MCRYCGGLFGSPVSARHQRIKPFALLVVRVVFAWRMVIERTHLRLEKMMEFKRQYIVNENNQKVAVQLDIGTFDEIENILENYALVKLITADDTKTLNIGDAKKYYASLDKA